MYSPNVIARNIAAIEKEFKIRLHRYEPGDSWDISASLGDAPRDLSPAEAAFVQNELLMSKCDWEYWTRYAYIAQDGGGAGPMVLRESQHLVLKRHLAPAQERIEAAVKAGEPTDGIRFYWHKARQLYATTTARTLIWHQLLCRNDSRALTAVANDDQLTPMYDRDKMLYDGLPWWMKPVLEFDVKDEHIHIADTHSRVAYAAGNQKGGMGQGSQFELQHLTECAFWDMPEYHIDYILKDTLPQSPLTLAIRESTANGRGDWWHTQTEDARFGRSSWGYVFIPWYAVSTKRRRVPPVDWIPDPLTLRHAEMVLRTSPEWVGRAVTLTKEQLYWWESERKDAQRKHALAMFYTNCPATPEESFQHHQKAAFEPEQIERWILGTSSPMNATEVAIRG